MDTCFSASNKSVGCSLPVPEGGVELDDDVLFLLGDVAPLHVGPQVVDPSQPAALAAPKQPCAEK
jgi:hypothetical protein